MPEVNLPKAIKNLNAQAAMEELTGYQNMTEAVIMIAMQADFAEVSQGVIYNFLQLLEYFAKKSSRLTEQLLLEGVG
jgi:hypothetical protein